MGAQEAVPGPSWVERAIDVEKRVTLLILVRIGRLTVEACVTLFIADL